MDNNSLRVALNNHLKIPFPSFSKPAALRDWIADLADLDGYVVGIAQSKLRGGKVIHEMGEKIIKLRKKLHAISKKATISDEALHHCEAYLSSLDNLQHEI